MCKVQFEHKNVNFTYVVHVGNIGSQVRLAITLEKLDALKEEIPLYLSPEVCRNSGDNKYKSDIWVSTVYMQVENHMQHILLMPDNEPTLTVQDSQPYC